VTEFETLASVATDMPSISTRLATDVLPLTHARAIGDVIDVGSTNTVPADVPSVVGPLASSDGETPDAMICMTQRP
jgi:hypothetical protein